MTTMSKLKSPRVLIIYFAHLLSEYFSDSNRDLSQRFAHFSYVVSQKVSSINEKMESLAAQTIKGDLPCLN